MGFQWSKPKILECNINCYTRIMKYVPKVLHETQRLFIKKLWCQGTIPCRAFFVKLSMFYWDLHAQKKNRSLASSGHIGFSSAPVEETQLFNPQSWTNIWYEQNRGVVIIVFFILWSPKITHAKLAKHEENATIQKICTMASSSSTNRRISSYKPINTVTPYNGLEQSIPVADFDWTATKLPNNQF